MSDILSQEEMDELLNKEVGNEHLGDEGSEPIVSASFLSSSVIKDENILNILDTKIEIVVLYGRKKLDISSMIGLKSGQVLELDKLQNEPVDILVNGSNVAVGELIIVDGVYSVRLSNLVSPEVRIQSLKTK